MSKQLEGAVTRAKLERWLDNRPELGLHEDGDNKGVYQRSTGPAWSFQVSGPTWRDVAAVLGAVEPKVRNDD